MRHTLRFAIFLVAGVLLACLITPLVAALSASLGIDIAPHRIWNRLALAALVISAFLVTPRGSSLRADEQPFRPLSGWKKETACGFLGGLLACTLLVCWLIFQGIMRTSMEFNWADDGLKLLFIVPLSAVSVALLEEWIFRHLLFVSFARDRGRVYAVLGTSLLFGFVHFFNLPRHTPAPESALFSGFEILRAMLGNALIGEQQLAFIGLCLSGLALALARVLTGRLFLALGLHASFVFFNGLDGPFTSWVVKEHTVWTGGRHYTAGFPGWIALLMLSGILLLLARGRGRRSASPALAPAPVPPAPSSRTSSPQERP